MLEIGLFIVLTHILCLDHVWNNVDSKYKDANIVYINLKATHFIHYDWTVRFREISETAEGFQLTK